MKLQILNKNHEILKEVSGEREMNLVYEKEYQEGDSFFLEVDEIDCFYHVQFDDAKGSSFVYLTGNVDYQIPFGEKRANLLSKVFQGDKHLLSVRKALEEENSTLLLDFKGVNAVRVGIDDRQETILTQDRISLQGLKKENIHSSWH